MSSLFNLFRDGLSSIPEFFLFHSIQVILTFASLLLLSTLEGACYCQVNTFTRYLDPPVGHPCEFPRASCSPLRYFVWCLTVLIFSTGTQSFPPVPAFSASIFVPRVFNYSLGNYVSFLSCWICSVQNCRGCLERPGDCGDGPISRRVPVVFFLRSVDF